jgi:hypothetical protein
MYERFGWQRCMLLVVAEKSAISVVARIEGSVALNRVEHTYCSLVRTSRELLHLPWHLNNLSAMQCSTTLREVIGGIVPVM